MSGKKKSSKKKYSSHKPALVTADEITHARIAGLAPVPYDKAAGVERAALFRENYIDEHSLTPEGCYWTEWEKVTRCCSCFNYIGPLEQKRMEAITRRCVKCGNVSKRVDLDIEIGRIKYLMRRAVLGLVRRRVAFIVQWPQQKPIYQDIDQ